MSSLPIYQASYLMAPKSISGQINKIIRDFLWQGGKGNQRKFHLVKWETAKQTLKEGGLQIRDPDSANVSMRCKILSKLHSNPNHPISTALRHKYLPNANLRNLQIANRKKSSLLWKLCTKGHSFFSWNLYRIPGNGEMRQAAD